MAADKRRGAKAVRFTPVRRARFAEVLRQTGNRRAAAAAAGVDVTTPERWCRKDAAFAADCNAALDAAQKRLAAARTPFDGVEDGRFEVIQRARTGRPMIMAVRGGRWTRDVEDRFFAALRGCGNVAACARLIGFSEASVWQRRRQWPAFAERMEQALEEAEIALEFRLATLGNAARADTDEDEAGPNAPRDAAADVPFDPEFALRFLKWREEKRRGGSRRPQTVPAPPSLEAVTQRIVRQVRAIKRHRKGPKA